MGELLQEFLKQTIFNLQTLQTESLGNETLSEDFLRRFFRQLHTIKGTSNTFNLSNLAYLAHQVEDLLQAIQNGRISPSTETNSLIQTSFGHLLQIAEDYLSERENVIPQDFTDQLRASLPNSKADSQKNLLYRQIPEKFLSQLSAQEKINLSAASQKGKKFYLLEVTFNLATFYEDFKSFKEIISQIGEAIAISSAAAENPLEEIAFQVFYVADLPKAEIEKSVKSFSVKFTFENSPAVLNNANNLAGMTANLIADGEKIAQVLDKKVVFETSLGILQIEHKHLILLNEIVSHLLHNAIDHAIETAEERIKHGKNPTAKIEISLSTVENKLLLQIKDDGRGIEVEKITRHAKEKSLIPSDQILTEKEALELIFSQGFSTSETVSEISGRGVGLDAVKDLVESSGGKIEIETNLGKGTIFRVYLPKN